MYYHGDKYILQIQIVVRVIIICVLREEHCRSAYCSCLNSMLLLLLLQLVTISNPTPHSKPDFERNLRNSNNVTRDQIKTYMLHSSYLNGRSDQNFGIRLVLATVFGISLTSLQYFCKFQVNISFSLRRSSICI